MAQGQQAESRASKAQPSMPVLALTLKASVFRDDTSASTVQQPHGPIDSGSQQTLPPSQRRLKLFWRALGRVLGLAREPRR